jgi:spore germination protein KC
MNFFLCRNIIKLVIILLLVFVSFLLTGCWDRREVNETALILGTAIDKEKGKNITLTVQVLIPRAGGGQMGGGTGTGGSTAQVLVRSAVGEDMADAASKLQVKFPRKLFWGHCKTYIIGDTLAKKGDINEQLDFLIRHPEPRERAQLFVSSGKAAGILEFKPPLEPYEGETLRKLAEMHTGVNVTVKDFEQMITGDARAAILPLLKKLPPEKGKKSEETTAYIMGTAIFKRDKMVGYIDIKLTKGLLWLRNEIGVTSVTIHPQKGQSISLDPIQETTKLLPTIKNGKWEMRVKVKSEGAIVQNGSRLDIMNPKVIKGVEKDLEKDIKQRIDQTITQVKKEMNVDAFGFADAFHRKYPKQWNKVKDHWDDVLPQVDVEVDITTRVNRPGLSTTPAGLKENEVEEK